MRWWIMWLDRRALRFISAEAPCWKGEIQIGKLLVGWQRDTKEGKD